MKKKLCFTLIEILVVATIIGLLAAAASISYSVLSKQSRDSRRKTDLEQIRSALEMYRSNNDNYPTDLNGLTTPVVYLQKIPQDPKSPQYSYAYLYISNSDYTIGAYLESASTTCQQVLVCGAANCNYCLGPFGQK
ncbi:MAG: type II secretion system protein [Microgenomates group bacterium]